MCGMFLFQGVIEFSLCLFFAKLVSYTFLFWLPKYIKKACKYKTLFSYSVGPFLGQARFLENLF